MNEPRVGRQKWRAVAELDSGQESKQEMTMTIRSLSVLAFALSLAGCASVRDLRFLSQPQNKPLSASPGATLFRLNKKGDLPNAYGGRDIYGGKVDKGFAEVKLLTIGEDGVLDLLVFDVSRDSTETTMNRYGFGQGFNLNMSQTVNIGGGGELGVKATIDTRKGREMVVSGVKVTFTEIKPSYVTYTLEDLERTQ
jgi:hypothetical protein